MRITFPTFWKPTPKWNSNFSSMRSISRKSKIKSIMSMNNRNIGNCKWRGWLKIKLDSKKLSIILAQPLVLLLSPKGLRKDRSRVMRGLKRRLKRNSQWYNFLKIWFKKKKRSSRKWPLSIIKCVSKLWTSKIKETMFNYFQVELILKLVKRETEMTKELLKI